MERTVRGFLVGLIILSRCICFAEDIPRDVVVGFKGVNDTTRMNEELRKLHARAENNGVNIAAINSVPAGAILMWSGAIIAIPTGWGLCDGTLYGAVQSPNLTDRFVIHADSDAGGTFDVGDTGGAHAYDIEHNHDAGSYAGAAAGAHTHTLDTGAFMAGGVDYALNTVANHSHSMSGTSANGGSTTQATIPKYYALAYIIKK